MGKVSFIILDQICTILIADKHIAATNIKPMERARNWIIIILV